MTSAGRWPGTTVCNGRTRDTERQIKLTCGCNGGLSSAIRRDLDRCVYSLYGEHRAPATAFVRVAILFPAIWVVVLYRLCHFFDARCRPALLGKLLLMCTYVPFRMIGVVLGVEINFRAHIGAGVLINHFGGIHIGPTVTGENCNISHGVTIGRSSKIHGSNLNSTTEHLDAPTVGDRVWIGPGAVIAGPITLGADSVVAANSLVTRDVPPLGVAMGVPARIVSHKGSFQQVSYRGMNQDTDRLAALADLRAPTPTEQTTE